MERIRKVIRWIGAACITVAIFTYWAVLISWRGDHEEDDQ